MAEAARDIRADTTPIPRPTGAALAAGPTGVTRIAGATMTIPELAKELRISRGSAYALAQKDALPIPVIRLGRRLVVSRAALARLLGEEQMA